MSSYDAAAAFTTFYGKLTIGKGSYIRVPTRAIIDEFVAENSEFADDRRECASTLAYYADAPVLDTNWHALRQGRDRP